MESLSLTEIKESQKETLLIFRDFCEKHKLKYYIAFGSLLGAVRHKGFIPWDDDVDILMPREDYDFLIRHFNDTIVNKREVISKELFPDYYLEFAKVIDRNTVLIEKGRTLKIGVWIDIFPMDYLIDDEVLYWKENRTIGVLSFLLRYASITPSKERAAYKNYIVRILNVILPSKEWLLNKKMKHVEKIVSVSKSNTYGLLYRNFGKYGVPRIPDYIFEPSVKLEFEGEYFDAPKEYDTLLRWCYGDYKKMPPKKKQKSYHCYTCYWEESCNN